MIKKPLAILFCLYLLNASVAYALSTDYQVYPYEPNAEYPSVFRYEIKPGDTVTDKLVLLNTSDTDNKISLYGVDSATTNDGKNLAYLTRDKNMKEVGKWLTFNHEEDTLFPKENKVIPFTISIPANTPLGTYKGGISAEKIYLNTNKIGSANINTALRVMSPVEIKVTNDPQPIAKKTYTVMSPYFWISASFFVIVMGYLLFSKLHNKKHHAKKG